MHIVLCGVQNKMLQVFLVQVFKSTSIFTMIHGYAMFSKI